MGSDPDIPNRDNGEEIMEIMGSDPDFPNKDIIKIIKVR